MEKIKTSTSGSIFYMPGTVAGSPPGVTHWAFTACEAGTAIIPTAQIRKPRQPEASTWPSGPQPANGEGGIGAQAAWFPSSSWLIWKAQ